MNLDARKDFREGPHAKSLHAAVEATWFHEAAKASLIHMQRAMGTPQDMQAAAAKSLQMSGAHLFLDIFMGLTESETARAKPTANLNHKV
jgi:hypothetical protein